MMARTRSENQLSTGVHEFIVHNESSGRFDAYVRRSGSLILRLADADTEANARTALHAALQTPLANTLIVERALLADTIESRTFAVRAMEFAGRNVQRTASADEVEELAKRLQPKAHALRSEMGQKDLETLWILLPGTANNFVTALDLLMRNPAAVLAELRISARPPSTRGRKVRGSRAAYLLKCIVESWIEVYGRAPRITKRFARLFEEVLRHYGQPVPQALLDWLRRETKKLRNSVAV